MKPATILIDSIANKGCSPESIQFAMQDIVIRCRNIEQQLGHEITLMRSEFKTVKQFERIRNINYLNLVCALNLISLMHLTPPAENQERAQIDVAIDVETEQLIAQKEIEFPKA